MFRNPWLRNWTLAVASVSVLTVFAGGDQILRAVSPQQNPQTTPQDPEQTGGRGGRGNQAAPPAPRPYAQVITAAAKTDEGIFKVHRVGETLYYEIPKAELGKDFLWDTQIKKTTIGAGYGGQAAGNRVVRWVTKGDRVLLLSIDYSLVADQSNPISQAIDDANYPTIIRAFNVAAYSPSGDPVIDVTPLFLTDVPEFSVRGRIGGRGFAPTRSFVERPWSFPQHVNFEVTQPFTRYDAAAAPAEGRGAPAARGGMRG